MPRSWKYAANRRPKDCEFCQVTYQPLSSTQLWCDECAPNRFFMVLIRKFGLSRPMYMGLLRKQRGRCAICRVTFAAGHNPGGSRKLRKKPFPCVDHDHVTGKARGLLCLRCNTRLGGRGDETVWLTQALKYVRTHTRKRRHGRAPHRQ